MSDKLQNYKCPTCSETITPPEILPAMINCGSVESVEFTIEIKYKCQKCKSNQASRRKGKLSVNTVEIYSVKNK